MGATLPLPRAVAQPAPTKTDKPTFELSPQKKDTFRKFVDLANMENVCKFPLDLKVKDATLEDVVAKVKKLLPPKTLIEVRGALPVRVTFDLHDTTVGGALTSVGSLAGCKLWVFADRVLLSPPGSLSGLENADIEAMTGGEWSRNVAAGGSGWWAKGLGKRELLLAMADIFQAATTVTTGANAPGAGALATVDANLPGAQSKTTPDGDAAQPSSHKNASTMLLFGDLSPDGQAIMTQLVGWAVSDARLQNPNVQAVTLSANTKISFDDSNPKSIRLNVENAPDSDLTPPHVFWSFSR